MFLAFLISFLIIKADIKQKTIDNPPELIIQTLIDNGYKISNIRMTGDEHPGPMFIPEYGIRADLELNDESYNLFIVLYDEFYKALKSSSLINQLDRRMNSGYAYAFNYGSVLVQVCPSDKDVGLKIVELLKEND